MELIGWGVKIGFLIIITNGLVQLVTNLFIYLF